MILYDFYLSQRLAPSVNKYRLIVTYYSIGTHISLKCDDCDPSEYEPLYRLKKNRHPISDDDTTSNINKSINSVNKLSIADINAWSTNKSKTKEILIDLKGLSIEELSSYHIGLIGSEMVNKCWTSKFTSSDKAFNHWKHKLFEGLGQGRVRTRKNNIKNNFKKGVDMILDEAKERDSEDEDDDDDDDTDNKDEESPGSNEGDYNPIQRVIQSCLQLALSPIQSVLHKILKQNDKIAQDVNENKRNINIIIDKLAPVRSGSIKHYFQMDVKQIYEQFTSEIQHLKQDQKKIKSEYVSMKRQKEKYRAKVNRMRSTLDKYRSAIGVQKLWISKLKPVVARKQQKARDDRIREIMVNLKLSANDVDYIKRRYNIEYKRDKLFRDWAMNATF